MEKRDINKKQLQTGKLTSKPNLKKQTNKKRSSKNSIVPADESDWKVRIKLRCYTEITGLKR